MPDEPGQARRATVVSLAQEYSALRQTIASRGTARVLLVPATVAGWAALSLVVLLNSEMPLASLFPLAVLASGFEAINALHVGVERIGRYLQVFHEEMSGDESVMPPRWESTTMARGPALPGSGADPLFSVLFVLAVAINLAVAILPEPTRPEVIVLTALHLALIVRIVRARRAAATQRAKDLEHYRDIRRGLRPEA